MRSYKVTGFVLRRHNLGEADRILTIFSREQGKLRAVAKGVRRSRSKLAGHLEPYIATKLQLARGRNLDIITSAQAERLYHFDVADLATVASAQLMLEMTDKMTAESSQNQAIYQLLAECLEAFEGQMDPDLVRHYFSFKLLDCVGQAPSLEFDPSWPSLYLSYELGAVTPIRPAGHSHNLSLSTIKFWRVINQFRLADVTRIKDVAELTADAAPILDGFYDYHIGLKFRSRELLKN